jgi:hypothetical protein
MPQSTNLVRGSAHLAGHWSAFAVLNMAKVHLNILTVGQLLVKKKRGWGSRGLATIEQSNFRRPDDSQRRSGWGRRMGHGPQAPETCGSDCLRVDEPIGVETLESA